MPLSYKKYVQFPLLFTYNLNTCLIEQADGSYTYHRGCPNDYNLNVNFGSDGCYELNGVRWSDTKGPFAKLCFTSRRKSMFVDVKMKVCVMSISLAQLTVNLQL